MKHPLRPTRLAAASAETRSASADGVARRETAKREALYDAELVRRSREGDDAAFAEIITRYRPKMIAVAYALLRDRHDAEEIAQDTFVRAHRGLARFRGECSLVTWLHRITVNLARNRYWFFHRRARHASLSLDCPLGDENAATLADLLPAQQSGPAREATVAEFSTLVNDCMARLDPSHREILTLRNILDQSYADIARSLGIEEGTVKSRIARARRCLRGLMAEACPEAGEDATPRDWLELGDAPERRGWSQAS